ncbi:class I SAM-dependent methyltransferase, partial [Ruminococcus sp.]
MLTKRLAACAALVTPGGVVCDVGTDHAYLPAELLRRGQCTRAVATDIHAGPLEAAKRTLTEAGVLEQAELFLCDGLAQVQPEGITDVVIAGMGGETIIHILEDCPWRRQVHLILQPMTKIPDLRRWLAEQGFSWTEQAVQEGEKFYVVLSVFHSGTPGILSLL